MQYFDGSESIHGKIQSAVVTIENKDGILYGCTKLELNEFLSQEELQEFTEYITGQYSDGWGEGFEQRDIKVDGGTMNVHFWHPNMEQPKMYEKKTEQIPTDVYKRQSCRCIESYTAESEKCTDNYVCKGRYSVQSTESAGEKSK